jgi:hypothetical protein
MTEVRGFKVPSRVKESATALADSGDRLTSASPLRQSRGSKLDDAAAKIVAIFEQRMSDMELSEAEKNAKISEMAKTVDAAVESKKDLRARHSKRSQTAGNRVSTRKSR